MWIPFAPCSSWGTRRTTHNPPRQSMIAPAPVKAMPKPCRLPPITQFCIVTPGNDPTRDQLPQHDESTNDVRHAAYLADACPNRLDLLSVCLADMGSSAGGQMWQDRLFWFLTLPRRAT